MAWRSNPAGQQVFPGCRAIGRRELGCTPSLQGGRKPPATAPLCREGKAAATFPRLSQGWKRRRRRHKKSHKNCQNKPPPYQLAGTRDGVTKRDAGSAPGVNLMPAELGGGGQDKPVTCRVIC